MSKESTWYRPIRTLDEANTHKIDQKICESFELVAHHIPPLETDFKRLKKLIHSKSDLIDLDDVRDQPPRSRSNTFSDIKKRTRANLKHDPMDEPLAKPDKKNATFYYRRQALVYALRLDKAIQAIDTTSKVLIRPHTRPLKEHIKYLRSLRVPNSNPPIFEYDDLRLIQNADIENLTFLLKQARYSPEPFTCEHFQKVRTETDRLCEKVHKYTTRQPSHKYKTFQF